MYILDILIIKLQVWELSFAQLAAEHPDFLPVLKYLTKVGFDLEFNSNWIKFPTPLLVAVRFNNIEATKFLLSQNVDINLTRIVGEYRPIWSAIMRGKHDIADLLLVQPGVMLDITSSAGAPILHTCLHNAPGYVEKLLSAGANPQFTYSFFPPLLSYAVVQNDGTIVKTLIKHGADLHVEDMNGETPLFSAMVTGKDFYRLFLQEP